VGPAERPGPFTIAGTGKQVRDVLHAEDLVALYEAAFAKRDAASGEIFNIGGGMDNSLSILELFEKLAKLTGLHELAYERLPRRQSDQDFFVADIAKAGRVLGWVPRVSCDEGLKRMVAWVDSTVR